MSSLSGRVTVRQIQISIAVLLILGAVYTWGAITLGFGRPFGSGSGSIPLLVGLSWCICCVYLLLKPSGTFVPLGDDAIWPDSSGTKLILLVLGYCAGFIILMHFIGVIPTSLIFLFCMALTFGGTFLQATLMSVFLSAAFWLVFVHLLQVDLPDGYLIEALSSGQ